MRPPNAILGPGWHVPGGWAYVAEAETRETVSNGLRHGHLKDLRHRHRQVLVRCACGREKVLLAYVLIAGRAKRCRPCRGDLTRKGLSRAESQRETYRRRRAEGRCVRCGETVEAARVGRSICGSCVEILTLKATA